MKQKIPSPTIRQIADALEEITPKIHREAISYTRRQGDLFDRTYGLCDLMTTLAFRRLPQTSLQTTAFIGIDLPKRSVHSLMTHSSHTLGVIYGFGNEDEKDKALWFDYACAQYGYDEELLYRVVDKEILYFDLRKTYGGGIWQPGGCWLSQINLDDFQKIYQNDPSL
jgi:hypothetical protein